MVVVVVVVVYPTYTPYESRAEGGVARVRTWAGGVDGAKARPPPATNANVAAAAAAAAVRVVGIFRRRCAAERSCGNMPAGTVQRRNKVVYSCAVQRFPGRVNPARVRTFGRIVAQSRQRAQRSLAN